ncbi:MAG: carboxypeptidase regulatory-like domain-containing protein [Candidatus Solibacter usitatus]|nr:carboxypeptidase regulatory-like domain-containing protein [Candidatus Solibacter usitatus]
MRLTVAAGVLCICVQCGWGQQSTARLLGTVTDQTGAVVVGAAVKAINSATRQERMAPTDQTGEYSIPLLPIGEYTVTVEAAGFKTGVIQGLVLQVNQEARVDVTLTVGATAETVAVEATAPLLVTDSSSVGQVIENKAIANMPLNGRAFWQLAQLTPGVVFTPGGSDITAGGQGIRATRIGLRISGSSRLAGGWLLDGFDITEYELGATSITPSTDALEEFKVQAGGMSAEYALPSVINAALKSGGNNFHGSFYEYLRNEKLEARNFFANSKTPLKRNQFGATLGGPIRRNHTFFFADYEGGRTRQGSTFNNVVPTAGELNGSYAAGRIFDPLTTRENPAQAGQFLRDPFPGGLIPAGRIAPQAAYFKPLFPTPNSGANRFVFSPALGLDSDKFDIKVTPKLTARDNLVSRYSFVHNEESDPAAYPALGVYPLRSRSQNVGLSHYHIFSPGLTSELTFNYYRTFFYFLNASNFNGVDVVAKAGIKGFEGVSSLQPAHPQINLSGYRAIEGSTDNRPKANRIRTYQYRGSLSWNHGRNDMKFGAQLSHQAHAFLNGNASQGTFNFDGRYTQNPLSAGNTGNAFADFLLGYPNSVQRAFPIQIFGNTGDFWSFYGQDNYRLARNFTLNVGLRWELNSFFDGIRGQTNAFDFQTGKVIIPTRNGSPDLDVQPGVRQILPVFRDLIETSEEKNLPWSIRYPSHRDVAPRVGFAWRPGGSEKWVVRSAYGIFYVYPDSNITLGQVRTPPFLILQVINNDVPTRTTLVPRRTLADYFLGQSLVDRNATPNISTGGTRYRTTYSQTWNFLVQRELGRNLAAEAGYVANKGTRTQHSTNYNIPLPGAGNVQARRPYKDWGVLDYKIWGGSSTYHSLQAKMEKRFSSGYSFLASYAWSKCLDGPGSEEGGSPVYYLDNLNKGPCAFDVPHNFVTSYIYELPFGKGRRFLSNAGRLADLVIGGWQWQGINTVQSGVPYSVGINGDRANTGAGGQRPDVAGKPVEPRDLGCWYFTSSNPTCKTLLPNQADAFLLPAQFTYGNAGRNFFRGDGLLQLDMSLIKNFRLTESRSLDFRAQVFNLTNTTSFSSPGGTVNLNTGGLVTSTRNKARVFEFGVKVNY